jgi:hypothetical protein
MSYSVRLRARKVALRVQLYADPDFSLSAGPGL